MGFSDVGFAVGLEVGWPENGRFVGVRVVGLAVGSGVRCDVGLAVVGCNDVGRADVGLRVGCAVDGLAVGAKVGFLLLGWIVGFLELGVGVGLKDGCRVVGR